jgi:hypothetical protein
VRLTLYTDKTVSQALAAINERMQAKGSASRTALDGWIEKNGTFSISMTSPVIGKFSRTTRLSGKIERQSGITVAHCDVPNGAPPRGRLWVFIALGLIALVLIGAGSPLIGIAILPLSVLIYIPLAGDYHNSAVLTTEVQRALKAKTTPPKPAKPAPKSAAPSRTTASLTTKDLFD